MNGDLEFLVRILGEETSLEVLKDYVDDTGRRTTEQQIAQEGLDRYIEQWHVVLIDTDMGPRLGMEQVESSEAPACARRSHPRSQIRTAMIAKGLSEATGIPQHNHDREWWLGYIEVPGSISLSRWYKEHYSPADES